MKSPNDVSRPDTKVGAERLAIYSDFAHPAVGGIARFAGRRSWACFYGMKRAFFEDLSTDSVDIAILFAIKTNI
jgi:hypothetical protein